jgi:predicted nucleic acid-binding protein
MKPMNNAKNIRSYSFQKTDRLFFDTNIWLEINNPFGNETGEKVRVYSNAYREIITQGIKIFIDVVVLSEFINRTTRLSFAQWVDEDPDRKEIQFKKYRTTSEFTSTKKAIESAVQTILMDCKPIETGFSSFDLSALISNFGLGQFDFNDLVIVETCKAYHLVLVTDDGDFQSSSIPILTYNHKLLGG